jgi:uncharacterized protein (DUF362 family)
MKNGISRRGFLKGSIAGVCLSFFNLFQKGAKGQATPPSPLFWIQDIPVQPFSPENPNHHAGIDALLQLMGENGLKFYRSVQEATLSGPSGMIEPDDVVLIKVNSQWKYRGCTNSDLIRGLIQAILEHPDGFTGEVVIFDNGQGRGSLNCDTSSGYPDGAVHANANNENQSFLYLVNTVFNNPRLSAYLLDRIGGTFIGANEHVRDGYRPYENVSYPCFTTDGGHRVELREGLWQGSAYSQKLKLINVPVLKTHGGSNMTASLKHFYGVVSMNDGNSDFRHYGGLGQTTGKMMVSVRTPVLNIIDAIWVSFSSLSGYPANATFQASQILASQDPVALDYWAAKYILYPISQKSYHLPTPGGTIDSWLTAARDLINGRGGLSNPDAGILIEAVTKDEQQMLTNVFALSDSVSIPNTPQGSANGLTGTIYTYTTGGSISGTGNPVQYLFDWGDETNSGWLPAGQSAASKSWASAGTYQVKVQARCADQTTVLSPWSETLLVTINPISVSVVSPNGAETWPAGSTQTIRWSCNGNIGSYVKIELLKPGTANHTIVSSVSARSGAYKWKIPSNQALGGDYSIKITSKSNSSYTDTSNPFAIVAPPSPAITVISPNGGDTWSAGSTQKIQWSYTGNIGGFVKIELLKPGVKNQTIASFVSIGSGGNGSYNWRIPPKQASGSNYTIRVTSKSNTGCTDTSDGDFSIN